MSFNECSVLIGLNPELSKERNFFEFVYAKIAKDQKNRYVLRGEDHIDILPFNSSGVRVIPSFKDVNIENLYDLDEEVSTASEAILDQNDEIAQVYIVCPKNEKFMKHIELKIPILEDQCKDEYKIKIIPYSLNSIIRDQDKVCCEGGCHATV